MKMKTGKNILIVMGVAGSGKTLVGNLLSHELTLPFFDADDFHSKENKEKMSDGIPLTDNDRYPWLASLNSHAKQYLNTGCIIACSALKEKYRRQLSSDIESVIQWIYLSGSYETIYRRIEERFDHYMGAEMLKSQFDDLEEPGEAISIDVSKSPNQIVKNIKQLLK